MSTATITFPTIRLAKLLRQPGGKSVAKALRDAEDAVAALAPPCLSAIDEAMASVERLVAEITPETEAETFKRLYSETNSIIGLASTAGLPEFDSAAYSLCDILDCMLRTRRMDHAVVIVHVRAMHLLRHPDAQGSKAAMRQILLGLNQVREKVIAASAGKYLQVKQQSGACRPWRN